LHPTPYCRRGRLLVKQALYTGRAEPRHRAYGGVFGPQRHGNPRAPPKGTASRQQTQELAAIIHLCGAGPAKAFARRGFHLIAGERCGDHDVATYLAQVNAMTLKFLRLAP
jgi:hypothetical protein